MPKDAEGWLAWFMYPLPDGRTLCETDLRDERVVEQLFDACQILEGAVSARGWRTLFGVHGLEGLLRINRRSEWFAQSEAPESLLRHSLTAGYDPRTDTLGTYNERTGEVDDPAT